MKILVFKPQNVRFESNGQIDGPYDRYVCSNLSQIVASKFWLKLFIQIMVFNFSHVGKVRQDFYEFLRPAFINVLEY